MGGVSTFRLFTSFFGVFYPPDANPRPHRTVEVGRDGPVLQPSSSGASWSKCNPFSASPLQRSKPCFRSKPLPILGGFSTEDPQNLPLLLHPTASITLDPDTAHPDLVLSEDRKSVKRGAGQQDLPDNPERFAYWPFVLGHPSFSSGRHCWEVEVGDEGDWAVGVARESIPRKGQLSLCPKGGIWGVEKWGGQIRALTTHKVTLLALRWVPRRVSIHLDYAGGTVAFFDADEGGLIFVFSHASFAGEGVRPWLWVVGVRSQLRLCP
ncbi:butyrophilin subfamily 1 member A1-like isoform X1 [Tympanuchus pallidicinctus]|uniref:butyrophilin subfamily 1 member A1-like isoform X1 n=1 Tax=Tympanuchus pallidicinctus TaxID=109042 RepID=UPI002286D110|nr:butyrophilin subfamily 1 member A1-like isoform X1 [Tympanuchus pallidicinctus]